MSTSKADPAFIQELNSMIEKEAHLLKLDILQETDWTIERMMKVHGLSAEQSRKLLNKLTQQGHFAKIRVANPEGGGFRLAYRPVEKQKAG